VLPNLAKETSTTTERETKKLEKIKVDAITHRVNKKFKFSSDHYVVIIAEYYNDNSGAIFSITVIFQFTTPRILMYIPPRNMWKKR